MNRALIKIRTIQLKRIIREMGLIYFLLIFLILLFMISGTFKVYQLSDKAFYAPCIISLCILSIHLSRKDYSFIANHFEAPVQSMFGEYFFFTLPFTLPALFTGSWFYFPLQQLLFYTIASIKINLKARTIFPGLSKIIPPGNFEWLSGSRKYYGWIIMLLLLSLFTSWLKIAPLVFLWLFSTMAASFYEECESLQILFAQSASAKQLILKKIRSHSMLLIAVLTPALFINSLFYPSMILINIIFILAQVSLLIFAILLKYRTYAPNDNLKANSMFIALGSLGALIPFLLPVPLIMSFRNYGKAIRNLNFYFNDQHS